MGAAAYNRGSKAISQHIDQESRPVEFQMMNGLPKYKDAGQPFGSIVFQYDGRMWWALDPVKRFAGFGFRHPSLHEAVKRWNVTVNGFDKGAWIADPRPRGVL